MAEPLKTPLPTAEQAIEHHLYNPLISLGNWNAYFLVKFLMFWKGSIGFHALENLAFAMFILVPVSSRRLRILKHTISTTVALLLLYYDSWLPSFDRLQAQISLVSKFDSVYLSELLGRLINLPILATIVISWLFYVMVMQRLRVGLLVTLSLITLTVLEQVTGSVPSAWQKSSALITQATTPAPSTQPTGKVDMNKLLNSFYEKESTRSVSFPIPSAQAIPFDVIFIHVCSLSWDDVRAVGLEEHPLWKHFDFLFTHFNSATSYSGPAAIRIQRATCGQPSNQALYKPVEGSCYLMSNLQHSGFEIQLAMNHDGHYDDFLKLVQEQNFNVKPMSLAGATVAQQAFDESPIYDDLSVLAHWINERQRVISPRVALYYNTVSLHDGNRMMGRKANFDSIESYKIRLTALLDNLEKFMDGIERSGRKAVVAVVPEHGAAVRGEQMQIAGMREIPSPRITLVPVGIKVVGGNVQRMGSQLTVEADTSYLAVSQIVAHMLEQSPFSGSNFNPADYVRDLPVTPFVSQSESAVVMKNNDKFFWRQGNEEWGEYR